jgi:hypothetical protein
MTTTKKRIHISVSREVEKALSVLAKRDQVPTATKAAELLRLGMEVDEDVLLEEVARGRYETSKRFLSHKRVWGN